MRPLQPITSAAPEAFYQCVCECELDATGIAECEPDATGVALRQTCVCVCECEPDAAGVALRQTCVCVRECELDAAGVALSQTDKHNMRHESKRLSRVCVCECEACVNAKRV